MKGLVPLYKMADEESNFMVIDALFAQFLKDFCRYFDEKKIHWKDLPLLRTESSYNETFPCLLEVKR